MAKAADYVPYTGLIVTRDEARAAGLKRYFDGQPCVHGHLAQRQTTNRKCLACKRLNSKEYMDAWIAKNRDKVREYGRKYSRSHRAQTRAYYEQNIDKALARSREWRLANPEAGRQAVEAWHKAHPDRVKRIHRKWVESNPEKVAVQSRLHRAKRRNADGKHTAAEVSALLAKQGGKCVYCHKSIVSKYHADHIVPLARGGTNWITNIQLTCPTCNHRKNRTDPLVFASRLGRLL